MLCIESCPEVRGLNHQKNRRSRVHTPAENILLSFSCGCHLNLNYPKISVDTCSKFFRCDRSSAGRSFSDGLCGTKSTSPTAATACRGSSHIFRLTTITAFRLAYGCILSLLTHFSLFIFSPFCAIGNLSFLFLFHSALSSEETVR